MSGVLIHKGRAAPEPHSFQGPEEDASALSLEASLSDLDHLHASEIRNLYRELFGRNVVLRLGIDVMRSALGFRLQEKSQGGLSRQAQLRFKALMGQSDKPNGSRLVANMNTIIKPGTRFIREWQCEVHEVQATDIGNSTYRGKNYQSLSVIANEITGTHQSGPRFFGLRKAKSRGHVNG